MLLCLFATRADAQDEHFYFRISPSPLSSALVAYAIQARVSLSMNAVAQCRSTSNGLTGHLSARAGLVRLLEGTGCKFRFLENGAVIVFAAPAAPRPHPSPAEAVSPAPIRVEEVIITSGQRPELLDRAPYSVSVLSAADISSSNATDLGGLAPLVGAVTLADLGPGQNKIFLRGLADSGVSGRTQSTVGLYLDGARVTYDAPDPDLRLTDIERVEVLRGPQGALYGAGSIGGVFEIVTRRPSLRDYTAAVDIDASETVGGAPSRSVDAVVNVPLAPGHLALRLVGYDEVQGGYLNNPSLGLANVNEVRRKGFRATLRWQVSPDWSVTASAARQVLHAADAQYADPAVGPYARNTPIQEPHGDDFTASAIDVSGHASWGDVTFTSSLVRQNRTSRFDASLALQYFAAPEGAEPSRFDENETSEILVNELSATSAATGRLRWLGGVFQSLTENESFSVLASGVVGASLPTPIYIERRRDRINELAAYGQLSYLVAPRLTLSAGGRLFASWLRTKSTVRQPLTAGRTRFLGHLTTTGFAPQVVLSYLLRDDVTLYVQGSEGYRSGGFNTAGLPDQVFSPAGGGPEPWRRYEGDELWNLEAGAKFTSFRGMARVRAAAFYMWWTNIQSDQLLANGLPYTANIGDARDAGVETDVDVRPDARWRVRLNAAIAKPEITHPNPNFVANPRFGLTGGWNYWANLQASYNRDLGRSLTLQLVGDCGYIGGANLTLDAATGREDVSHVVTGQLSAALIHKNWTATVYVKAPLVGGSDTFGFGNPFSFRVLDQTTPARPATIGLKLAVGFP